MVGKARQQEPEAATYIMCTFKEQRGRGDGSQFALFQDPDPQDDAIHIWVFIGSPCSVTPLSKPF